MVCNLDDEFTELSLNLLTHLENTNVTVKQLKGRISLLPGYISVCISPLWNKLRKNVEEVGDTMIDLFTAVHMQLWNFLDYYLLEHLIKKCGSENLKERMCEYLVKINCFKKNTLVIPFIECWDGHNRDIPEYIDLEVKFELSDITLADLDRFRKKMKRKCLPFLSDYASGMFYRYFNKGCVHISWFILERFSQLLRKNIEALHSLFEEYHVCLVKLKGDNLYSIDYKLMKLGK